MAKQSPVFLNNSGNLQIMGGDEIINEALIQYASSSGDGIISASDYITFKAGGSGGGDYNYQSLPAKGTVAIRKVVYVDASGKVSYATKSDDVKSQVLGFSTNSGDSGASIKVATGGKLGGFSGLIPGGCVWLGLNGVWTQTVPSSSGVHVAKIGQAVNASSIEIRVHPTIKLS